MKSLLLFVVPLFGVTLLSSFCVAADSSADADNTAITRTQVIEFARSWGLTIDEWDRYESLIDGPRGIWSPNIDPITVLGIEATTIEEQEKYASLYVEKFHERVMKEQRFQITLNRVRQDYYENIPVSVAAHNPKANSYALFISAKSCSDECSHWLNRGMGFVSIDDVTLHIYLSEAPNEQDVRKWAVDWSIPLRMIYDEKVVLHIENGQHSRVVKDLETDTFPILVAMTETGIQEVLF